MPDIYIFYFSSLPLCRGGTDKRKEALLPSGNNRDESETVPDTIYFGGILELVDSCKSSYLRVKRTECLQAVLHTSRFVI